MPNIGLLGRPVEAALCRHRQTEKGKTCGDMRSPLHVHVLRDATFAGEHLNFPLKRTLLRARRVLNSIPRGEQMIRRAWGAMKFFLIPAILLAIQSIWSLRGGFKFLALIRKNRTRTAGTYQPRVALIIPCKELDENLRLSAKCFLSQNYPWYQVIFAVASENDPAYGYLRNCPVGDPAHENGIAGSTRKASIVIAGYSEKNGEKVNNLLAGLSAVDPEAEVLTFADADAQPPRDWLRFLVAPLEDPDITVSTGYRWYLPSASLASRLRAAWDTSIATLMGEHDRNFAWGGSMAIRLADFKRLRIAEHYWQGTVSDDYALTRGVRDAGGKIHFESRCLVPSQSDLSLAELISWTNRQIIITRVYAGHYWRMGVASHSLYALTFIWGLALLFVPGVSAGLKATAAAFLAGILVLGILKGAMRTVAAREMFPSLRSVLGRYGACYWRLAPFIPWIMVYNFIGAGFRRRIAWCGTVYELKSRSELRVVDRRS